MRLFLLVLVLIATKALGIEIFLKHGTSAGAISVFTSKDIKVGELASGIESEFNGKIKIHKITKNNLKLRFNLSLEESEVKAKSILSWWCEVSPREKKQNLEYLPFAYKYPEEAKVYLRRVSRNLGLEGEVNEAKQGGCAIL